MKQLLGLTLEEMGRVVSALGMPSFAAAQIFDWVYCKRVADIAQMSNLSQKNRDLLGRAGYQVGRSAPVHSVCSADGTSKHLFKIGEGSFVEAVFIPDGERATLCLSTQVGCKMNCLFCMTGKQGFAGNLTAAQMLNQFYSIPGSERLTNIVFMGMGEPCDNLDEVLRTVQLLTHPRGAAWSPRRITISTVGLKKGLRRLLDECDCHVAVSLHAALPQCRSRLMPAERGFSIAQIVEQLRGYDFSGQRRLSFEYIVFEGVNDSRADADALLRLLRGLQCRVNLISYHAIPGVPLRGVERSAMLAFRDYLTGHGLFTTLRASRGEDVFAACGMLSTDKKKREADNADEQNNNPQRYEEKK